MPGTGRVGLTADSPMRARALLIEFLIFLVFFVIFVPVPLFAHHSTAEFDLKHSANAAGVVTRFEWSNPHAHIYIDQAAPDGSVEHWLIEIDSPNALQRKGWSKDSLKPDDRISCSGARAKDGSPHMRCTEVKLASGAVMHSF
jgi:Family of unknown function (DUF6152)